MNWKRQTTVSILFLAGLAGPAVYQQLRPSAEARQDIGPPAVDPTVRRYGFALEESAEALGISFRHEPPAIAANLSHIGPQIAAMGASVAVVDFDRDGWQDLYVTNSGPGSRNSLFRNQGDGTFRDVAQEVGLAELNRAGDGACMGSVWADYDNDGFEDVLVYKWGTVELYRNRKGTSFERVQDAGALPAWANLGSATWLDYDRDGYVDLFLAGYWPDSLRLEKTESTRIMPDSFEYAGNGGRKWLLRNVGGQRFEDVTEAVGISSSRWTLAVVSADLNEDGFPDLFLANDYGVSELYLNEQGRRFREVGREVGIGLSPKSGMNAAVGDVLNEGKLSIYETNISEDGVLLQGNNLWYPVTGGPLRFQNLAPAMGVELGGWSFGAQFGDLNNDGLLDLFCTNGYFSGEPGTSYWYDFSQITGGHARIISDAENWPAMRGRSLAGYQAKRLWLNDGGGGFQEVARAVGVVERFDGRGVAVADLGNRGMLDVIVANQRGPLLVYRNTVESSHHHVTFQLEGTRSNRSAIGARITAYFDGQRQVQEVVAASGYAAQSQRRAHFGLGTCDRLEKVEIRWPDGTTQVIESPEVDRLHTVREPQ